MHFYSVAFLTCCRDICCRTNGFGPKAAFRGPPLLVLIMMRVDNDDDNSYYYGDDNSYKYGDDNFHKSGLTTMLEMRILTVMGLKSRGVNHVAYDNCADDGN